MKHYSKLLTLIFILCLIKAKSQDSVLDSIWSCNDNNALVTSEMLNGDKATIMKGYNWKKNQVITVCFLEGSPELREKVKKYAVEWSKYCSLKFKFVDDKYAFIRIVFRPGKNGYSLIGKNSVRNSIDNKTGRYITSRNGHTMNLPPLYSERAFRALVLHEFGHALSMVHEHQNPRVKIPWIKSVVYKDMAAQGWTKDEVNHNIFNRYSDNGVYDSPYDPTSIMIYAIPPTWVSDPKYSVAKTYEISEKDKEFIERIYGPSTAIEDHQVPEEDTLEYTKFHEFICSMGSKNYELESIQDSIKNEPKIESGKQAKIIQELENAKIAKYIAYSIAFILLVLIGFFWIKRSKT